MPAETGVSIHGLRELSAAFALADRQSRRIFKGELRKIAEPVRREAEGLSLSKIRRMEASPRWSKMRTGVTRTVVYVAPRQRGVKKGGAGNPRRRPNLAGLLMDRAMEPALHHHEGQIAHEVEHALDRIADDFNR